MRILLSRACRVAVPLILTAWPLAAADTLTPFDVARLRTVTTVALSPDGSRVAYTLSVPRRPFDEEDGPAWSELHVVGRDGVSRPFITGPVNVGNISWTKDGREIAFLARRGKDESRCLYAIPADGGEARRILCHGAEISGYSLAPDGKRVAFLAAEEVPKGRKDLEKKGFNQQVYEESAKPVRVWIASLVDGAAGPKALEIAGSASDLKWSPAGSLLAFALAPTSLVDDGYMRRRVTVADADSGKIVARIENPGKLGQIAWSPDGKNLAYLAGADANDPSAGRLMIVPPAGGAPRDLLPGYEGNVARISWRDADTVTFVGGEGVETILGEVHRDHPGRANQHRGGPAITDFDLSRDGKTVAMVAQTAAHPGEVFLWAPPERAPRRLTTSNPWLSGKRFALQEVVKFKARDGLDLEGLLIHPLDERKGERYPLILTVHGGPEGHYSNGWLTGYSDPGQVAAARGFAVFYPNYRGSTGRGVAFSKLSQADPAGKEFDDLVDAVDHLIAAGLVDRAKVGVTGGSYGGYATAWCSTRYSDRFAAGVMFVGISDLVSKAGTTDIPMEELAVHARRWPWEDWKLALERSPIFYADKSRTPLLILDGKDDPRVHPSQSLVFYRYLKVRSQAPVRLVLYPGEGHGNRNAAHRLDYNLRMIQWMEHYLKGKGGEPPPYEMRYEAPDEKSP
ncbi:MAG TPA: S9 family peptidase [Thermoanaerobaculia bacterium]|nr:S9 family peptidase [Thermoanaerobaculia bacterium]